jgi:hypothetical protein
MAVLRFALWTLDTFSPPVWHLWRVVFNPILDFSRLHIVMFWPVIHVSGLVPAGDLLHRVLEVSLGGCLATHLHVSLWLNIGFFLGIMFAFCRKLICSAWDGLPSPRGILGNHWAWPLVFVLAQKKEMSQDAFRCSLQG